MPHHMHHQHKAPIVERDAQVVETVFNYVYVTAGPNDPVPVPEATPEPVASNRENGAPINKTREPAAAESSAAPSPSYHAPPRQQRPHSAANKASSSEAVLAVSSAPLATSRVAGSPIQQQHTTLLSSQSINPFAAGAATATGIGSGFSTAAPISSHVAKSDNGMSGGAKAGVAFAVILGVALVAGIAFFMIRRKQKKNEEHQRLDDEKTDLHKRSASASSNNSGARGTTAAPRLSLRPVSNIWSSQPMSEKHDAAALTTGFGAAPRSRTPEPAPENPFGDHAEDKSVIATPVAAAAPTPITPKPDSISQQAPRQESAAFPVAVAGSRRNSPPGPGQNNVHRVHMDFKPSMDDELELRAGSLVRMLHEYDDGWALCIRLDRSQQGVVPRTCISKLPVKPRPAPPPGARGPAPQGRPRNGSNASNPRNSPPTGAARPFPPGGPRVRAQTNGPLRPVSPPQAAQIAPEGRPRANSDAMAARRITPPSPMSSSPTSSAPSSPPQVHVAARKPVPGQAM